MSRTARPATHAGTWYSGSPARLAEEIKGWMDTARPAKVPEIRALISPHAGLRYSGATAAYSYCHATMAGVSRVFILGPAHHEYIEGIAVTPFTHWATPFGHLTVDTVTTQALQAASTPEAPVAVLSARADEDEHSVELQTPFLAYQLRDGAGGVRSDVQIVPIVVGCITRLQEAQYGRLLAPYLSDPATLVCISSDFCHWGSRFRYTPHDPAYPRIHNSIEALDRQGMDLIAAQDCEGWAQYLDTTKNTICGRAPISILLHALQVLGHRHAVRWLHYAQSQPAMSKADSSVSYAAAVVLATDTDEE
eukprot:EG_transcript_17346